MNETPVGLPVARLCEWVRHDPDLEFCEDAATCWAWVTDVVGSGWYPFCTRHGTIFSEEGARTIS